MLVLEGCARPTIGSRGWSTYTVLGFVGYVAGSLFGAFASVAWGLTFAERLVAVLAPPLAFLATVVIVTAIKGRELIVFYECAVSAVVAVIGLGALTGGRVPRMLDVAVLGIGLCQALGRIGCFHVACCHGRPARRGVVYGPSHVAAGLGPRWAGRPLFPVQLVESGALLALFGAALAAGDPPGTAAVTFAIGYGLARFALELLRGDPVRPFAYGLSESQWFGVGVVAACAAWRPTAESLAALVVILLGAGVLMARRRARELIAPPHLGELDRLCAAILADPSGARRQSRLGLAVSCHPLGDGRLDWVMSATHPRWSAAIARDIGAALWPDAQLVTGRAPGVFHLITGAARSTSASAMRYG